MPDLGPYAVTVLSAYAVTLGILGALAAWSWLASRQAKRRLADLEGPER